MVRAFGERLGRGDRRELVHAVEAFRRGRVPLAVPRSLLRRLAWRDEVRELEGQSSLEPYPIELTLANFD